MHGSRVCERRSGYSDQDTIAKFRRRNLELVEKAFLQVLELAGHMSLLKLGTICIDGTKIQGNADSTKNLTMAQIEEELGQRERRNALLEEAITKLEERLQPTETRIKTILFDSSKRHTVLKIKTENT